MIEIALQFTDHVILLYIGIQVGPPNHQNASVSSQYRSKQIGHDL